MECPRCHKLESAVVDSRLAEHNKAIRRRRQCDKCGFRFSTIERIRQEAFVVIKKDGTREPYNRQKLEEGIWKACIKRPIDQEQIDRLLTKLEAKWALRKEIPSTKIGKDVMGALLKLDQVAYIRFASVYDSFSDLNSFQKLLTSLRSTKK
ncbi:MAG: transcriptional regulator NrdR [Candidatus Abawacabacteria bacterium RBG_16_42_10]|uniref:Transcriptional repressor NrdR n=1 Tax=Candidatus Abawacabacteria bacterium RBG_16_42_10 TaxID=1817814 RepID=A0A1F4XL85_9BACT|nr:MAG: transcriptional regulator NrdR [Candidatus Abawacabacteria bacterium RBG_16_42_10]